MKAVVVEPKKRPYVKDIDGELGGLQEAVGGYVEAIYPFDDNVAILCNEEGKLTGMDLNRALRNDNGDIYDIIAGTFLVVGLTEDDFGDLTDEQVEKYTEMYKEPEEFVRIMGKIIAIPVKVLEETGKSIIDACREIDKESR